MENGSNYPIIIVALQILLTLACLYSLTPVLKEVEKLEELNKALATDPQAVVEVSSQIPTILDKVDNIANAACATLLVDYIVVIMLYFVYLDCMGRLCTLSRTDKVMNLCISTAMQSLIGIIYLQIFSSHQNLVAKLKAIKPTKISSAKKK
jgi:hypothetical protein